MRKQDLGYPRFGSCMSCPHQNASLDPPVMPMEAFVVMFSGKLYTYDDDESEIDGVGTAFNFYSSGSSS